MLDAPQAAAAYTGAETVIEIAAHLHITPKTIEYHKYQIMLRLNLQTSPQLISSAVKHAVAGV